MTPASAALTDPARIRDTAFAITSAFEGGRYDGYQNFDAGIVSYGLFQFTLASGSLARVIDRYLERSTTPTADGLRGYQERIRGRDPSLRDDTTLKALLKQAATEDVMREAQVAVATEMYWDVAQTRSIQPRGVTTPLGQALFFDLAIHYGPGHSVASRAEEKLGVPVKSRLGENGITEQQLLHEMALIRRADHYAQAASTGLNGLKVRGDFWVALVERGDWMLEGDEQGTVTIFSRRVKIWEPPAAGEGEGAHPVEGSTTEAAPPFNEDRVRRAAYAISAAFEGASGYDHYALSDEHIVAYGFLAFSLASGLLANVINRYFLTTRSLAGARLQTFQGRIQARDATLAAEPGLYPALMRVSDDPAMKAAQEAIALEKMWAPVRAAALARGLKRPLSWAMLFDMLSDHGVSGLTNLLQRTETALGGPPGGEGITEERFIQQLASENRVAVYRKSQITHRPEMKARADFWIARLASADWDLQGEADGAVKVLARRVQVRAP